MLCSYIRSDTSALHSPGMRIKAHAHARTGKLLTEVAVVVSVVPAPHLHPRVLRCCRAFISAFACDCATCYALCYYDSDTARNFNGPPECNALLYRTRRAHVCVYSKHFHDHTEQRTAYAPFLLQTLRRTRANAADGDDDDDDDV